MDPTTRELILGAYKLDTELLLVLDLDKITHVGAGSGHKGEAS